MVPYLRAFPQSQKVRDLDILLVKPKQQKYSKKNNPALELIKKVREDYWKLNPRQQPYYSYQQYEKITIGVNNYYQDLIDPTNKLLRFYSQFTDTAIWTGKRVLLLSLKEEIGNMYAGKEIGEDFKVVTAQRNVGLDENLNQSNIKSVLSDFIRATDIYENDLVILQNHFVSPLAAIAPDYYKYEITDTVYVGNDRCAEISFVPHNPESYSFNGKIYIPVSDSLKYVKRIVMRVPRSINLNFVKSLVLSQNYQKDETDKIHKTMDVMTSELQMAKNTPEIYASRIQFLSNFNNTAFASDSLKTNRFDRTLIKEEAHNLSDTFWTEHRPFTLKWGEGNIHKINREAPPSRMGDILKFLLTICIDDHIPVCTPAKLEIGPVSTAVSHNDIEGMRFCAGGITTPKLWKQLFMGGYLAYGSLDRKLKYMGEIEYSFNKKDYSHNDFPIHSINVSYRYDVDRIGQKYDFAGPTGFLSSFTRTSKNLFVYTRNAQLDYTLELPNNFSLQTECILKEYLPTQWVMFKNGMGAEFSSISQPEFKITARYSPGQRFLQGIRNRSRISLEAPIFMLSHTYIPKGILGSQFEVNKTEVSFWKRVWFSSFGYTDILLRSGIVWSQVSFLSLPWQNSNITYTLQPESFTLLNPMELAMDRYFSWDLSYFMSGLLFNRIPLLNRLKLREVIGFKGFAGKLSNKNNPELNPHLLNFPAESNTQVMGKRPYMEFSVGVDNIFSAIRLDYVWRMSYLNAVGIDKSGLRVALHFSF